MIYFAITEDGDIHNLGDHGDYEAADCTAQDMQMNAYYIADEYQAASWADFILSELKVGESTK